TAISLPWPDESIDLVTTDPPYYDSVPYSHLSDMFFLWLKATLNDRHHELFSGDLTDKAREIVEDCAHSKTPTRKDANFYENALREAFIDARRVVNADAPMVVVFAHKSTQGWESMLSGLLQAGWIIVGSWPIDTERPERMNAYQNASLLSS